MSTSTAVLNQATAYQNLSQPRILVVEDEENLLEAIKINLELEGYEVVVAITGPQALKRFREERFNLVVLDIMLPELDGYQVCQTIRITNTETPILFLTAKDTSEDKVMGLKMGADDYLTKPFNLEEFLLRVKVLIRHSMKGTADEMSTHIFSFDENEINFSTFIAKGKSKNPIQLTKREAALLKLLIERKNEVVSRKQILQTVWGYDVFPSTRTIDNFILTFRKYFEKDSRNPVYFHSIRGVGYKFTDH
ncbi:MAG: response regulator transcription factor [Chitinophagaceae bacterium]|nr:response regulator transcription factor [Chitinophagaceae bacterium]